MRKEVTVNVKYDVDLRLLDLSAEIYHRIMEYIEREIPDEAVGEDGNMKSDTVFEPMSVKDLCAAFSKNEEGSAEEEEAVDEYEKLFDEMTNYGVLRDIKPIFIDAHKHPEKYTREYKTSIGFGTDYCEVLKEWTTANIAKGLIECARVLPDCDKKNEYNQTSKKYENRWLVPVPVENPEETEIKRNENDIPLKAIRREDYMRGMALRNARQAARLSVSELADLIGCSGDLIVKWEIGEYSISTDMEKQLKKLFGEDLFDKKKEA